MLEALEAQELVALLPGLSDRERAVLRARYGLDGEEAESLRAVAARLGVSAERVRQIERRAWARRGDPARRLLHRPRQQALHEVALEGEEERQRDHHGDERRGRDQVQVGAELA